MAISPKCDSCKKELLEFGGILLSPPDKNSNVVKFHLCSPCYVKVTKALHIKISTATK